MRSLIALAAALSVAASAAAQPTGADPFVGTWHGALTTGTRAHLALEIARDSAGALRGALVAVDEGGQRVPATVTTRGDTLVVALPAIRGEYVATLSAAGDSLRGTLRGVTASTPLAMGRGAAVAAVRRPQQPAPPFPYHTEEVSFPSAQGVRLAGTLTLPAGAGPFPAVLLVTGSGPQDRDETIFEHRPFLVLADHLARHGIASLRVDDRGVGRSTGSFVGATSADFADDAEAGVRFLQSRPGVARDRVGILGHSEGAVVGPLVAARSRDVAFLVLLAGPGVRGDSVLLLQSAALLAATPLDSAAVARTLRFNRATYDALRSDDDSAAVAARIRAAAEAFVAEMPPAARSPAAVDALTRQGVASRSPWLRWFLAYDPQPTLRRVRVPVLALNGTLDRQVPYRENLAAIEAALRGGGDRDVRAVALPGLNHLFQTATTGAPSEYGAIAETFSPAALDLISGWIGQRFGGR